MSFIEDVEKLLSKYDTITETECKSAVRLLNKKAESEPFIHKKGLCLICKKVELEYVIHHQHKKSGAKWFNKYSSIVHLTNLIHDHNGVKFKNDLGQIHLKSMLGYLCKTCQNDLREIAKPLKKKCKEQRLLDRIEFAKMQNEIQAINRNNSLVIFADEKNSLYERFSALNLIIRNQEADELKELKYYEFLNTKYWDVVRRYKLKRSKYKCELCNAKGATLNVHHKTYKNHGFEHNHLEDLVVLCRECHAKFHDKVANEPT